jgi:hypothetical protein
MLRVGLADPVPRAPCPVPRAPCPVGVAAGGAQRSCTRSPRRAACRPRSRAARSTPSSPQTPGACPACSDPCAARGSLTARGRRAEGEGRGPGGVRMRRVRLAPIWHTDVRHAGTGAWAGGRAGSSEFERLMHSFVDRDLHNLLPVLGMVSPRSPRSLTTHTHQCRRVCASREAAGAVRQPRAASYRRLARGTAAPRVWGGSGAMPAACRLPPGSRLLRPSPPPAAVCTG